MSLLYIPHRFLDQVDKNDIINQLKTINIDIPTTISQNDAIKLYQRYMKRPTPPCIENFKSEFEYTDIYWDDKYIYIGCFFDYQVIEDISTNYKTVISRSDQSSNVPYALDINNITGSINNHLGNLLFYQRLKGSNLSPKLINYWTCDRHSYKNGESEINSHRFSTCDWKISDYLSPIPYGFLVRESMDASLDYILKYRSSTDIQLTKILSIVAKKISDLEKIYRVYHGDMHPQNILYNEKSNQWVFVRPYDPTFYDSTFNPIVYKNLTPTPYEPNRDLNCFINILIKEYKIKLQI